MFIKGLIAEKNDFLTVSNTKLIITKDTETRDSDSRSGSKRRRIIKMNQVKMSKSINKSPIQNKIVLKMTQNCFFLRLLSFT